MASSAKANLLNDGVADTLGSTSAVWAAGPHPRTAVSSSVPSFSRSRLRPAAGRHQGMMDGRPYSGALSCHGDCHEKGPEWRTSSAASSMPFLDWYGLGSLTGT